ncbi:MAG: hypothetical protein WKF34_13055 [Pyrinomonadaceae bacterium]
MRPGEEIVSEGIADLAAGRETVNSLLVSISVLRVYVGAAWKFLQRHFLILNTDSIFLLCEKYDNAAHSKYNSLIRRLVSFERSMNVSRPGKNQSKGG